jgi:hypothetical protein
MLWVLLTVDLSHINTQGDKNMPNLSGSFAGKASSHMTAVVGDVSNHELGLVTISGPQMVSDPLWNGAIVSYWGMADLIDGSGLQTGYFINRHPNGDIDRGTFEGRITTAGGAVTQEGTWKFSGGTGAFARISGGGSFKIKLTSPTEVECNWEGAYQLG